MLPSNMNRSLPILVLLLSGTLARVIDTPEKSLEQFNNDMYTSIATQQPNVDVFFSPLGIHTVLAMIYSGAGGETKTALTNVLHTGEPEQTADSYDTLITLLNDVKNVTLYTANKVYIQQGYKLQEEYDNTIKEKYHSEVDNSLDFGVDPAAAATAINSWVDDKTKGKIDKVFEGKNFNSYTRLVLVNAVYFKGSWQQKFLKDLTRTEPFYVNGEDEKIEVQMMHRRGDFMHKKDDELGASVVVLPFNGDGVTLTIVLPTDVKGISEVEKKIAEYGLANIGKGLKSEPIRVSVPKFKVETEMNLEQPLTDVGLEVLFKPGCNVSKMIESDEPLSVSKFVQKAFIEVNEEGAEAAAVTGAIFETKTARIIIYEDFYVDHPFFVVLKKDDVILFYGKIMRPVSGDNEVAPKGEPTREQKPPYFALFNRAEHQ